MLAGVLVLLGFTVLRAVELDGAAYVGLICGAVLGGINIVLGYKVTGRALESGTVTAMSPEEIERCLDLAFGDLSILKRWDFYREKEKAAMESSN